MSFGSSRSMSVISWNSSRISTAWRSRSAASSPGQLEQALQRLVQVLRRSPGREAEADRGVLRVDDHGRPDAQVLEHAQALLDPKQRGRNVLVDGGASFSASRSLVGVVIRSTWATSTRFHQPLRHPPHERRLAVPAGREQHHVLAVADVCLELRDLVLAVGERVIERQRAVAEGVGRFGSH